MSENEFNGEDLAGMSRDQLYEIMCQMKSLIDRNHQQSRQILIQNPQLTRVLFRAQIMLGMVPPSAPATNNPPAASQNPPQPALVPQQTHAQAALPMPGQTDFPDQTRASQNPQSLRKPYQSVMPVSSASITTLNSQSQPLPSNPSELVQQSKGHNNSPVLQFSEIQNMVLPSVHSASAQPSTLPQPPMLTASSQTQLPYPTSGISYMHLQPPSMPSQTRPALAPSFIHQFNTQMRPNAGFQHSTAVQMHHSQPMFNSGQNHPASTGHQSHPAQPQHQSRYQGSPHLGMEFSQTGGPMQAERGPWIPGLRDNTTGTQNIPGPPSFMAGQMGPPSQLPRPPSATPGVESAVLQQVMSLTPEQINLLPLDQRNQVLQLQQMVRQSQ